MTIQREPGIELPDRFEIVKGEIVPLMPTGDLHGIVEPRVTRMLGSEAEDAGLGLVLGGEVGVVVVQNPLTVRGADGAFYLQHQLPYKTTPERYLLTPPALVVEVLSPNDRASEVQGKILEYLAVGVLVVWVVDPATRSVQVYIPDGTTRILRGDQKLFAPGVLESLQTTVAWLFRSLPQSDQPPAA
ncbi:MAG: Uma2 family endonuclease [Candidatus Xenobia bacterium]